jgi:hypothetical protein
MIKWEINFFSHLAHSVCKVVKRAVGTVEHGLMVLDGPRRRAHVEHNGGTSPVLGGGAQQGEKFLSKKNGS